MIHITKDLEKKIKKLWFEQKMPVSEMVKKLGTQTMNFSVMRVMLKLPPKTLVNPKNVKLRELWLEHKPISYITKKLCYSRQYIYKMVQIMGLPRRLKQRISAEQQSDLTQKIHTDFYAGFSNKEIAKKHNCTLKFVTKSLRGHTRQKFNYLKHREQLAAMLRNKETLTSIAKEFNLSYGTIFRWKVRLKKEGLL